MLNSKILKDLLSSHKTLVVPDAYDPISARIIEYLGFKAVQCSGYSFSIAACETDETSIDFEENLSLTSKIIKAVSIPVMADGEDGFGGLDRIPATIESYLRAGAAGVNLEDLVPDKSQGIKIIDAQLMVEKIKAARNTSVKINNL